MLCFSKKTSANFACMATPESLNEKEDANGF